MRRGVEAGRNDTWWPHFGLNRRGRAHDDQLILSDDVAESMIAHLRECLPLEGAGLLSVVDEPAGMIADRFYPVRNRDASPTRFTMDPGGILATVREMELRGTRLGAIVHSHPRTPAEPSRGDLAEATVPGALSVIVGFQPSVTVRAWRFLFDGSGVVTGAIERPIVRRPAERPGTRRLASEGTGAGSSRDDDRTEGT